ncbi:uncharacterized protein [Henckelia pumila]|uniref:uncharacterized protein n=1 Tax=Henckelia pumila TaxID=405737 RepID=UPI003C6DD346
MVTEGIVLGHRISEQGIEVERAKVQVIQNLPPPTTIKEFRSFLGHTGFYRRFIKDFSKIAKPLSSLLMKDTPFNFDFTCLQAFEFLREILVTAPVLTSPDWDLPFEVMCNASDLAVGVVLGQRIDKVFRTIYYASKTLNEAQLNYATTEKELLAVVFALDKFHSYLVISKITIYTDHSAIKHLLAKKDAKPRLIRWILLLQEFDNDTKGIDDWFPDEKLFAIEHSSWYANFANYLVTVTLPHNLSFHQKKKFLSDVKHYFWEEPFLFKIGADSMIRRCVAEGELKSIISHCHDHEVGGHAGHIKTAAKVLECERRLLELNQLEEFQDQAYDMAMSYKERTKKIHDRRIRHREIKEGEAVLFFNSKLRLFLGNLKSRWSGPYKITKVYPSGSIDIKDARNESFYGQCSEAETLCMG